MPCSFAQNCRWFHTRNLAGRLSAMKPRGATRGPIDAEHSRAATRCRRSVLRSRLNKATAHVSAPVNGECKTMSSVAVNSGMARSGAFNSVVGRKIVMAVTGVIPRVHPGAHGRETADFLGPERINAYGRSCTRTWSCCGRRGSCCSCRGLHVLAAWQLTILNNFKARPIAY